MSKLVIPQGLVDRIEKLVKSEYVRGEHGVREIPNPVPRFVDVSPIKRLTIAERVRRIIRHDLSRVMVDQGHESFDDANDFDVEDDISDAPLSQAQVMTEEFLRRSEERAEKGAEAPVEDVIEAQEVEKEDNESGTKKAEE